MTLAFPFVQATEHGYNFVLTAEAHGLGTCWMRRIDEAAIARILRLPENIAIIAVMPLGYPAETPAAKPRKPAKDYLLNPEQLEL